MRSMRRAADAAFVVALFFSIASSLPVLFVMFVVLCVYDSCRRKVLQKWYPPDFDHTKIQRIKKEKQYGETHYFGRQRRACLRGILSGDDGHGILPSGKAGSVIGLHG